MNSNIKHYPIIDEKNRVLNIHYNDDYVYARYDARFLKTIENKGQARHARKKTGCDFIITGDVFCNKLHWVKCCHYYGFKQNSKSTGMAIIRDEKIIWYSLPGIPEGSSTRTVMVEKIGYMNHAFKK